MAIDDATLEKLKKLDDKEKIKKLLKKKLPDLEKRFKERKEGKDKDKKKKLPDDFLDKFRFNPENRKRYMEPMPFKPDLDKKRYMEPMPYRLKPSDKMPGVQLLKKGGTVKGYKAGGEVKTDKSPNSGMITKRGWGASRKT